MKNRTIIGIICIALAVAVMFGISPFMSILSSEKIDVIQTNKYIAEGSQITEKDVITVQVGKLGTSKSVVTDAKDVVGKFATTDIYPETNLISMMVTSDASNTETVLKTLNKDNMAISITVPTMAAALSGKLENGDIVSILVSTEDKTFTPKELTYVRVITTTTSEGIDQDNLATSEDAKKTLPATVTLLVSPLQAELLAEYEQKADIHLTLVSRGDADAAKAYLSEQTSVLNQVIADRLLDELEQENIPAETIPAETEGTETEGTGENNG